MRKGLNPNKDKTGGTAYLHQVIIPIYIPQLKGYFTESLQVLKVCIQSLVKSSQPYTFISLVSNGSCREVEEYLKFLYNTGEIQEVIFTSNTGKYNAIIKALSGHNIPLVTISDADIFFKPNWQEETFKIFKNFKKAGVVGLIPQFLSYQSQCENLIFDHLFSSKLKFGKVEEPEALIKFYRSIGWKPNYPKERLRFALYLNHKNVKAVVGAGHAVATYRRELFDRIANFNQFKMGGNSEEILDSLAPIKGYYRFTTPKNMAFHLGNKLEKNYLDELNSANHLSVGNVPFPKLSVFVSNRFTLPYFLKHKGIQTIFKSHKLRMLYLGQLGLPKTARKSF